MVPFRGNLVSGQHKWNFAAVQVKGNENKGSLIYFEA